MFGAKVYFLPALSRVLEEKRQEMRQFNAINDHYFQDVVFSFKRKDKILLLQTHLRC